MRLVSLLSCRRPMLGRKPAGGAAPVTQGLPTRRRRDVHVRHGLVAMVTALAAIPAAGQGAAPVDQHVYAVDTARAVAALSRPGTVLIVGAPESYFQQAVLAQLRSLGYPVVEDGASRSGTAVSFSLSAPAADAPAKVRLTVGVRTIARNYAAETGRPIGEWAALSPADEPMRALPERDQLYRLGRSVEAQSLERAMTYYRLAADLGQADANLRLGLLLVARDRTAEAVRYLAASSAAGNAQAQYVLGLAYMRGTGVAKDVAAGQRLLAKSAAGGIAAARQVLDAR